MIDALHSSTCLNFEAMPLPCPACSTTVPSWWWWPLFFLVVVADADAAPPQPQLRMGVRPNCTTSCGGVSVPYPVGIEPGCHLGDSFRLTCDDTHKQPAPRPRRVAVPGHEHLPR
jgi:hypothetical protein